MKIPKAALVKRCLSLVILVCLGVNLSGCGIGIPAALLNAAPLLLLKNDAANTGSNLAYLQNKDEINPKKESTSNNLDINDLDKFPEESQDTAPCENS